MWILALPLVSCLILERFQVTSESKGMLLPSDQEQWFADLRSESRHGAAEQCTFLKTFPERSELQNGVDFVLPSALLRAFLFCSSLGLKRWPNCQQRNHPGGCGAWMAERNKAPPTPWWSPKEGALYWSRFLQGLWRLALQSLLCPHSFNSPQMLLLWWGLHKTRAEISPSQWYFTAPFGPILRQ